MKSLAIIASVLLMGSSIFASSDSLHPKDSRITCSLGSPDSFFVQFQMPIVHLPSGPQTVAFGNLSAPSNEVMLSKADGKIQVSFQSFFCGVAIVLDKSTVEQAHIQCEDSPATPMNCQVQ